MRTFIGGNNSDTTSAVRSYLSTTDKVYLADLVLIGELEAQFAEFLTNWETDLNWPVWGTFNAAAINRGKLTSQVGLQVDSLDFEWSPPLTAFGTTLATSNAYQRAQSGFYDSKKFRMWRTIMPTAGDANTYGACEVFGGRVQDTVIERGKITFTVNSFLDVVNQMVPPNVIESPSTLASFVGNVPVVSDSETTLPQFTVVAPSNNTVISAVCTSPSAGKVYSSGKFQRGFLAFNRGSTLDGYWSPIASNGKVNAGGGVFYNQFAVYAAFPWAPTIGDTFYASTQMPLNAQEAVAGYPYDGFRWVPQPEGAI